MSFASTSIWLFMSFKDLAALFLLAWLVSQLERESIASTRDWSNFLMWEAIALIFMAASNFLSSLVVGEDILMENCLNLGELEGELGELDF